MSWKPLQALLDAKLLTLSGLGKVSFPGIPFTPPTGETWHKVDLIPAAVDPAMYGGPDHERGIYQVTVFAPSGRGTGDLLAAADAVAALFSRQILTGGGVTLQCSVPVPGPVLVEPNWLHVPVSIPFQSI